MITTLTFSTKARTLKQLETMLKSARVLPQISFTVGEYRKDIGILSLALQMQSQAKELEGMPFIVRSSAQNEDTAISSNAGKFLSIGDVNGEEELARAVSEVAIAMGDDEENEIFIQPYLNAVSLCGVAFTVDPNTGGNYYVLNYDDTTGSTSSVTAGDGTALKTCYLFKGEKTDDLTLSVIIKALEELQELFENKALDVEYAISDGSLYILQVRPLVMTRKLADITEQRELIHRIMGKIHADATHHPYLYGEKTIYGVMPDWNPAEMIGIRPRPLALSLYKELITDSVWAYQRNNYGYKNMRSFPLLVDFCGLPYIDTRISFNSFLPKGLSDELSNRLTNFYIDRLAEDKSKHDKIEFEIVFTCYSFDIEKRLSGLNDFGFSNADISEIANQLRTLTNKIVNNKEGLWRVDSSKIDVLKARRESVLASDMTLVSKIYWLLEYCKRYGTLPFAGLARAGFIAVQLLNSLVSTGVITDVEKAAYMSGLNTVSTDISRDFSLMSKAAFLQKYGHLRPGTYDIRSHRYDSAPDDYFDFSGTEEIPIKAVPEFKLSINQFSQIEALLKEHKITCNALELFDFIKSAIEGREYAKFVFTQTLSDILEMLVQLGTEYGISRDELSFVDIQIIADLYSSSDSLSELLYSSIESGKKRYAQTCGLTLPPVIVDENDVCEFFMPDDSANFITQQGCEAEAAVISIKTPSAALAGKILLIKSADPGYDWIFSHHIAGFITAYGGVNSHMAIRAAELNIPAVIGVGEKLYATYEKARRIRLDCAARKVEILK